MIKIILLLLVSLNVNAKMNPTSEIPEKREFPVNEKINPCEDFYEYTCSNVRASFKLRPDRTSHTFSFSDSSERLLESKKKYLSELNKQAKKTKGEVELNDLFMSCMNVEQRAVDERKEVLKTVKLVSEIKTRDEFKKFLSDKVGTEEFNFMDFGSVSNQQNPKINDVLFGEDLRGLPERSYYKKKKVIKAYKSLLKSFFKEIGLEEKKDRVEALIDFEKGFDKTYPTPKEWRIIWSQPLQITRKDLLEKYPEFGLERFLNKIPKKTIIRHYTPKTYDFVKNALNTYELDTLKSIYLYHALSGMMDQGYKSFSNRKHIFRALHLGGPKKRPVLKERCTNYVKGSFMKELDYELYPKLFGKFSKKKFLGLVNKVRKSLLNSIAKNEWLSKEGKKAAKKKMKTAFMQVVKPNNKGEWGMLPLANYSSKSHIENLKIRKRVRNEDGLKSFRRKNNSKEWGWGPLLVNAYYSPSNNKFVMPAGILQYPFYDQSLPDHMNLGAIGMVVGHELGHGVDDSGSKYDHKGRVRQWMTKADLAEFKKRGDKLIAQFESIGHDGKLTLGENIGDLVGVTTAYEAAFPKGEGSIKEKKEFFVQLGRSWCTVATKGAEERRLKTDSHSLPRARINEQVKHQPGFVEAFSCKAGDKMFMAEKDRVRIW